MSQKYTDIVVLDTLESDEMKRVIGGRRGADDPAGHDANDDKGGRRGGKGRGRGGKGRGGADDGPNHT